MKKILEYQQLDSELFALDKQYETLKEHEIMAKMSALYKEMQAKLLELENDAKKLNEEYLETLKDYESTVKNTKKLSDENVLGLDDAKLNEKLENANKLSSDLFMLERKLNQTLTKINEILKSFEETKNKVLAVKTKHAEAKQALENIKAQIEPKKAEIAKQLSKLESGLNATLYAKYKALKHDNVFPVFVTLSDKRCGYCRVDVPSGRVDELKNSEYIVCENCARLIVNSQFLN